jgi:hypothetical protein
MEGRHVVEEIRMVSAVYRDRYKQWPREVRMDSVRLRALTAACTDGGFRTIAAHVRVGSRDSAGLSAGGRGVVELDGAAPTAASIKAASLWLGAVELCPVATIKVDSGFWFDLAQATLQRLPDHEEFALVHLLLSFGMSPNQLESPETREEWMHELLFQFAYVASFGLHGVHPKTLHVTWAGHGWQRENVYELRIALQLEDGRTVTCDPPWHLITEFGATRAELPSAAVRLGEGIAAIVGEMGRAGSPPA